MAMVDKPTHQKMEDKGKIPENPDLFQVAQLIDNYNDNMLYLSCTGYNSQKECRKKISGTKRRTLPAQCRKR
jgi:hypothetical protein